MTRCVIWTLCVLAGGFGLSRFHATDTAAGRGNAVPPVCAMVGPKPAAAPAVSNLAVHVERQPGVVKPADALCGLGPSRPVVQAGHFLHMKVTAYTAGPESTGKRPGDPAYGITASGKPVTYNNGMIAAADWRVLPCGTVVNVPNWGRVVICDKGGAIKGNRLDLFMPDVETAREFGVRWLDVTIEGAEHGK